MNADGWSGRIPALDAPAPASAVGALHLACPAEPVRLSGVRAGVSDWARAAGLSADLLIDLLLAVGEAAANVVDHAYSGAAPGPLCVDLRLVDRRSGRFVVARIADRGRWRPADGRPATGRGRGLPMIRALAAHVEIVTNRRGTHVDLELAVPPPERDEPRPQGRGSRARRA